jgi:hypothetical protein
MRDKIVPRKKALILRRPPQAAVSRTMLRIALRRMAAN